MSRVFGRFSFGSFKPAAGGKKTLMQQLMTSLPHWVFIRNTLPDQDTVVNVKQVGGWVCAVRACERVFVHVLQSWCSLCNKARCSKRHRRASGLCLTVLALPSTAAHMRQALRCVVFRSERLCTSSARASVGPSFQVKLRGVVT